MKKLIYIFLLILCCSGCHKTTTNIVFFYSTTCPNCEKVEAFFNAEHVRNKVVFTEKEVSQNKNNLIALVKMQKRCGMPMKGYVQVPLLWTGEKCITGYPDIIRFFRGKIEK